MKKSIFVTAILAFFLIALGVTPSVIAFPIEMGQIQIASDYGEYQVGDGGEFTVKPIPATPYQNLRWASILNSYDSKTKSIGISGSFQTFCLELQEPIGAGHTYRVDLNNEAINGGVGPAGDPISVGTAWLYHQFQSGTLEDYKYTGNRWASAAELQDAIWWLEGEIEVDPEDVLENAFAAAVIAMFGTSGSAMANNDGQYPVNVLNLYSLTDTQDQFRQDLLVCDPAPVPEPTTMLLLGSGLIGLAGLARKRFRKQ